VHLAKLTQEERHRFLPLCPTLVVELRWPADELHSLKAKLEEYRDNGARLGWLIDPTTAKVYVYRPGRKVEILRRPEVLVGDPELVGLGIGMKGIWELGW
jgi:Uma2 family endonuclease